MTWNRWSHSSICNKNDANNIFSGWYKIGFEIKNEIEGQGQSSPKFLGILRVLRCIIGPNLEILSWIGAEWWHGQAQNMAIFYFEVKFDLEVQGQLPPKTIGILTKVFCSSSLNLVILAWTGDKLSRGQASDYRTHRRTHRQTQATTIPEGQNWPRVINMKQGNRIVHSRMFCVGRLKKTLNATPLVSELLLDGRMHEQALCIWSIDLRGSVM